MFLHPFRDKTSLIPILENHSIEGLFGKEPRVESLTMLRNDLYRLIEDAVRDWVNEQKFIPRFLLSALCFLLAYFFMAIIIPDPIPLLDELLISLGASGLVFFFLSRRDRNSSLAAKKRLELRTKIDQIVFNESPFVKEIEQYLQSKESEDPEILVESILEGNPQAETALDQKHAEKLIEYLENCFGTKELQKKEKNLAKIKPDNRTQEKEKLYRWAQSRKIDLSLFALYRYMKSRVKNTQ